MHDYDDEWVLSGGCQQCVCVGGSRSHLTGTDRQRERECVCVCVCDRERRRQRVRVRVRDKDRQTYRERDIETENGESNSNLLLLCLILRILLHFWMLWQYNFNFYSVAASPLWFFLFSCRVSINKNIWKKVTICWSSSTFSEAECPIANRFSRNSDESSQAMGLLQSSS